MTNAILRVKCADRTGIVAALSDFVFRYGGNIVDADQHSEGDRFFMRLEWTMEGFSLDRSGIDDALKVLAQAFEDMHWDLDFTDKRQRVAVFCSKTPHCLYDLLIRQQMGEIGGQITVVISNHEDLRQVTEHFGLPYHHLPISSETRPEVERKQQELLEEHGIDLVVLARYMQIISPDLVAKWRNRMINIHHSFLPAFVGARPYHQAKERGVKIIGATAHYVTDELDQGPIIEQDVCRITHRDTVEDMIRKGRDLERQVLGRAVRLHLHHHVVVESNRTVILV
jgi:formyltetrahydrofolate deformylase